MIGTERSDDGLKKTHVSMQQNSSRLFAYFTYSLNA